MGEVSVLFDGQSGDSAEIIQTDNSGVVSMTYKGSSGATGRTEYELSGQTNTATKII